MLSSIKTSKEEVDRMLTIQSNLCEVWLNGTCVLLHISKLWERRKTEKNEYQSVHTYSIQDHIKTINSMKIVWMVLTKQALGNHATDILYHMICLYKLVSLTPVFLFIDVIIVLHFVDNITVQYFAVTIWKYFFPPNAAYWIMF